MNGVEFVIDGRGGLNFPKWLGFFIVTVDPFVLEIVKPPAAVQKDILHLEVLTQSKEKHFFPRI